MNCAIGNFLNLKRLISFSYGIYLLSKGARHPKLVFSKFSCISPNAGFLIAGCCFSRKSDEKPLLSDIKRNDSTDSEINKSVESQCKESSVRMKRKVECDEITVEPIINHENNLVDQVVEPHNSCKKAKTSAVEPLEEAESVQQKCSVEDNIDAFHISTGSQQLSRIEKPKKQRPNYFVAIRISDEQIHKELKEVQDLILEKEKRLKKSMIELKTLHITLMVMYINDPETHNRALKALESIHLEHDKGMSEDPLQLEFKGLSHFQNRVLYAKLSSDSSYERLCSLVKSVKEHFASESIISTDTREHFTPHLTVAKIDFKKKQHNFVKKIDPSLYRNYNDHYFGSQKVESIQLLSMTNPKTEAGYYSGDEIYFSAFNPSNRLSCLNKLLAIEEKKKNVKEIINMLAKEKLK